MDEQTSRVEKALRGLAGAGPLRANTDPSPLTWQEFLKTTLAATPKK
jgi:hypothetical protein